MGLSVDRAKELYKNSGRKAKYENLQNSRGEKVFNQFNEAYETKSIGVKIDNQLEKILQEKMIFTDNNRKQWTIEGKNNSANGATYGIDDVFEAPEFKGHPFKEASRSMPDHFRMYCLVNGITKEEMKSLADFDEQNPMPEELKNRLVSLKKDFYSMIINHDMDAVVDFYTNLSVMSEEYVDTALSFNNIDSISNKDVKDMALLCSGANSYFSQTLELDNTNEPAETIEITKRVDERLRSMNKPYTMKQASNVFWLQSSVMDDVTPLKLEGKKDFENRTAESFQYYEDVNDHINTSATQMLAGIATTNIVANEVTSGMTPSEKIANLPTPRSVSHIHTTYLKDFKDQIANQQEQTINNVFNNNDREINEPGNLRQRLVEIAPTSNADSKNGNAAEFQKINEALHAVDVLEKKIAQARDTTRKNALGVELYSAYENLSSVVDGYLNTDYASNELQDQRYALALEIKDMATFNMSQAKEQYFAMSNEQKEFYDKVVENVAKLKEAVPEINITPEQIRKHCSMAILEKHSIAENLVKERDKQVEITESVTKSIENQFFNRVAYTYMNPNATQEENSAYYDNLTKINKEGQDYAKQLYMGFLNDIRNTDFSLYDKTRIPELQIMKNIGNNMNHLNRVMDNLWESGMSHNGLAVAENKKDLARKLSRNGQVLGGIGKTYISKFSDMNNLFLPLEFLSDQQVKSLLDKKVGATKEERNQFSEIIKAELGLRVLGNNTPERIDEPVEDNILVSTVPSIEVVRKDLDSYSKNLQTEELKAVQNEAFKKFVSNVQAMSKLMNEVDFSKNTYKLDETRDAYRKLREEIVSAANDAAKDLNGNKDAASVAAMKELRSVSTWLTSKGNQVRFLLADMEDKAKRDVENEYADDFEVDDKALENAAPEEMSQEEMHEVNVLGSYERSFNEVVSTIKSVDANFDSSNINKESYVNNECVDLHNQVKEYYDKANSMKNYVDNVKKVPVVSGFKRIFGRMHDLRGTEEANSYNQKLDKLFFAPSQEGVEFRKELFANLLNDAARIDVDMFDPSRTSFMDTVRYVVENKEMFSRLFDYEYAFKTIKDEASMSVRPDLKERLQEAVDTAVLFGGYGNSILDLVSSEAFLTMPFNEMSMEQTQNTLMRFMTMSNNPDADPETKAHFLELGNCANQVMQYVGAKDLYFNSTLGRQNPRNVFSKDDFIDLTNELATPEQLKEKVEQLNKELNATDPFYVVSNTEYFKNFKASLNRLNDLVQEKDFAKNHSEELRAALEDVKTQANNYKEHVGAAGKNERQQARLDIAKKIPTLFEGIDKNFRMERFLENAKNGIVKEKNPTMDLENTKNGFAKRTEKAQKLASDFAKMNGEKWAGMNKFMKQVVDSYKTLTDYAKVAGDKNMLKDIHSKEYKALTTILAFEQNIAAITKAQTTDTIKPNTVVDIINKGKVNAIIAKNNDLLLPIIEEAKMDKSGLDDFMSYRPKDMAALFKNVMEKHQEEAAKAGNAEPEAHKEAKQVKEQKAAENQNANIMI